MAIVKIPPLLCALALLALLAFSASTASAQTLRTYVSGLGDDANPGTRLAPMRTFQAAHDNTLPGGEINCLDAGNFGPVAIGKSLTIDGRGVAAGISGGVGFGVAVVGATGTINVVLRNLDLTGHETTASGNSIGVRVTGSAVVKIERCTINGFGDAGIDFRTNTAASSLYVSDCSVHNCNAQGIIVNPVSATCTATIIRTIISECGGAGVRSEPGATVFAKEVTATGNGGGFSATAGSNMTVSNCTSTFNGQGVATGGVTELIATDVFRNAGPGLFKSGAGLLRSNKNNRVFGNNPDGTPNGTVPFK